MDRPSLERLEELWSLALKDFHGIGGGPASSASRSIDERPEQRVKPIGALRSLLNRSSFLALTCIPPVSVRT